MKNRKEIKQEVVKIIYPNSHDQSDGLLIKFENIHKVIELLIDLVENKQNDKHNTNNL